MNPTRQAAAVRFAKQHADRSGMYRAFGDGGGAVATGNLSGLDGINSWISNESDREAYTQFRRWTYVAISAICRRLGGFEFTAGDVVAKGKSANGAASKGWFKNPGESFGRLELNERDAEGLPKSVRRHLGGQMKNSSLAIQVLDFHPVIELLNSPNHVQGKAELIFFLVANLLLTGEGYLLAGESSEGRQEIWAVPSTWIDVSHGEKLFGKFFLNVNGIRKEIPAGAITRIYYPDPSDPKKVLSPVKANLQAIQTDAALQTAHKSSFDQGIFPKIALTVGRNIDHEGRQTATRPVLDASQREQLIAAIQSVWMSTAGDGLPAILDGLIEDVKTLQTSPVEMDYLNSSKLIKERIFQAFGLNPIIVGEIVASNKAQALVAEQNFMKNVLGPIADSIGTTLTPWVRPWYTKPKNLVIWLEREEPIDDDLTLSKWKAAIERNVVSEDEYRYTILGLQPRDPKSRPESRSPMFNNPQAMTQLTQLIAAVNAGAVPYDAAVSQVERFFEVDNATAVSMLGERPEIDKDDDDALDSEAENADSEAENGKAAKKKALAV